MHHVGSQPVAGLELLGLGKRLRRLKLCQVHCDLASGGLDEIGILPVEIGLCRRTGQHHEANHVIMHDQGNNQPGMWHFHQPVGKFEVTVQLWITRKLVYIDEPAPLGHKPNQ